MPAVPKLLSQESSTPHKPFLLEDPEGTWAKDPVANQRRACQCIGPSQTLAVPASSMEESPLMRRRNRVCAPLLPVLRCYCVVSLLSEVEM